MTRRPAGALLVIGALCVVACNGGETVGEPLPPLTATASPLPSESVSATPTAPTFPETPQGAADFARFVYAEIDRAYAEKDPEILRAISLDDCMTCQNVIRSIESLRADGAEAIGGESTVLSAEAPGGQSDPVEVSVRLRNNEFTVRSSSGEVVLREPASDSQVSVVLTRAMGGWLVRALILVPE